MRFKRNIKLLLVWIIPFALLAIACLGYITIPTIMKLLINGQKISPTELVSVLFITILIFGEEVYLCYKAFSESSIEFSKIAIRKPGIRTKIIKWDEIVSVKRSKAGLSIRSEKHEINILLAFYNEPSKIEEFIAFRLDEISNLDLQT